MRPGLVFALMLTMSACGGERATRAGAKTPVTVKEDAEPRTAAKGKKWGGWRYQGARDDCFFRFKRRCFTKRADACAAARCGKKQCVIEGGGPAIVSCQ
jgi:hypothetical protein